MQDNILLGINGTRAVASYVCEEIALILENKAQSFAIPMVSSIIREYKDVILTYKAYLDRPETLADNRLNEKEGYNSNGANQYATSTDGFITNITFTTTRPLSNFAFITKPFTSIASIIGDYL